MLQKIVKRPLLTEKTLALAAKGWYTFAADKLARKEQIAAQIEKLYNVKVTVIRTMFLRGKVRRSGRKMLMLKKPDWKKALVRLSQGQTIAAFTVAPEGEKK